MRICFLSDFRSIHTLRWLKFFVPKHEVHLVSLEKPSGDGRMLSPEEYTKIGIRIHLVNGQRARRVLVPFEVRRTIKQIQPDIIHCHYISHYGFLGAFSGFRPSVMTAWGTDVLIEPDESTVKRFQVKYALKRADIVTCDGENTVAKLVALGVPPEKVQRIYFGVDTARASPDKRDPQVFAKFKKTADSPVIIDIRGFTPVYDPATFIKAAVKVLKERPDALFVMAREGDERKQFEDLVATLGIKGNLAFIGNIPADKIPVYLASTDIYVSTSLSDSGIAASTAEAMACGAAVISTRVGDIDIWIHDGVNGFVIEKSDTDALADKINALLVDEQLRRSIGIKARESMLERQDYNKEMGKVESLYEKLIGGKK
ncbi:MAG TPA: glycosyltransferase family 4 protein [Methanomassiliicoccales archaeon]|nr:glycosyltransferase family 4 protein [Methanomassiliicoccales archaeon]